MSYKKKFEQSISKTNFKNLTKENQEFIKKEAFKYEFSFQELKQLIDFAIDFRMWHEGDISSFFEKEYPNRKVAFSDIRKKWEELKQKPNSYKNFTKDLYKDDIRKFSFVNFEGDKTALGSCPVASPNTRCCNLLTLDAVQSCGFDCSYCSIQSFYNQDKIGFDVNFKKKS